MSEFPPRTVPAHDLVGDIWLNTDPLAVNDLRGQVILLFFWDFACGRSLALLPAVQELSRRYGPSGLVAVGVHSPKFPFSGDPARVRREALRIGVTFPVVVDSGLHVWSRYECRSWPTILLIDADGYVRSRHEGADRSLEQTVRHLLHDAGYSEDLPDPAGVTEGEDLPDEVFAGYLRGSIGNVEGVVPESTQVYADPEYYQPGRIYLEGPWECLRESVRSAGRATAIIPYAGREAHLVVGAERTEGVELRVTEDDRPIAAETAGADIRQSPPGETTILVREPGLYSLTRHGVRQNRRLRISCPEEGVELFAVSFIAGSLPDGISRN